MFILLIEARFMGWILDHGTAAGEEDKFFLTVYTE
jgi:hypothetical protein